MSYIEVNNLKKDFIVKKKHEKGKLLREKEIVNALKGVSFSVEKGELVGYIGPNGAGKSTTVKVLSGILTPDSGEVTVGGIVPWKERKRHVKNIGVVFGQRSQLWWDVPIVDSYSLLRDIYRITKGDYEDRLKELAGALQLEPLMRTPLRLLSLGQRMRAELCGSLLHRPELLFLDEPTIGLDAVSKLALREFLKWENNEYGTTIMLTTHDMEDIEALCSRVMVLGHGKKLFDGKLQDLLERYDTVRNVNIKYDGEISDLRLPEGTSFRRTEDGIELSYDPSKLSTSKLLGLLQEAGNISELTLQPENTDHMIAAMYKELDL
ncbi:ABC transporter ATP-binding protein [Butyrivibrio proteoclasticus B316]|uniref:ABC transporter ATP-binding protein n=1 Tax=Butyrivibrio proteoclasticus (strain ATCC 51982 / DSM 14932 / B316) TaxID=515622 RepID=E0S0T4_BUTPB|nr:ATP-binding cassette domain-containing protein [Butyrivibrio proteoclasticus]ADL33409.1 ABC transporter ATP-binding protein [Butyrivibrio proteoclasticus B316]